MEWVFTGAVLKHVREQVGQPAGRFLEGCCGSKETADRLERGWYQQDRVRTVVRQAVETYFDDPSGHVLSGAAMLRSFEAVDGSLASSRKLLDAVFRLIYAVWR